MFTNLTGLFFVALTVASCNVNSQTTNLTKDKGLPNLTSTPPPVDADIPKSRTPDLQILSSDTVRCGDVNYEIQKINNIDKQIFEVRLLTPENRVLHTIEMPEVDEVQGFALNGVNTTNKGFVISIEWGTRIYHEVQFNFDCIKSSFVLTKLIHKSLDQHFPEDSRKQRREIKTIEPSVPFKEFRLSDFLTD